MAETLSAGVRKVPDGAVSRVEPMRTQSQAAVHAADRAFAAMMSRSAVGPVNHNQHGPARSAATDPAVHPQTLFDDVDELLGDPTEGLFEILDDWLLHE